MCRSSCSAGGAGAPVSAIALTDAQVRSLRARFDAHGATPQAHASTWSRRLYAPFFIDAPEMADVKRAILRAHPRHVVAFDIVFESRGNETAWHTDYESLGPFVVRDALVVLARERDGERRGSPHRHPCETLR